MIKKGIIRDVLSNREYTTKDGRKKAVVTIKVEFPFYTANGKTSSDFMIMERHTDEADKATIMQHIDQERELTFYLDVRTYDNPNRGRQYFQDCRLTQIKTVD